MSTNFIYMETYVPAEGDFRKICRIGRCRALAQYRLNVPRLNLATGLVITDSRFVCPKHSLKFRHLEIPCPAK